ncbi:thiamine diphosphokinase [Nitriliruptor alkaliphilus]|uniref:thiamine diphosphokinase n=1 Tax=Nitriliruptor alkaliphilus TaxID=427918 RepID=UPI000695A7D8|nr:thiamine diphosphokinase [Nitriliruptor alkaliphilus]
MTPPSPPSPRTPADAIVLADGDPVDAATVGQLPTRAVVIAADGGLRLAGPLGLRTDLVVGDFDSVDPDLLAAAEADGTVVERHPVAKDRTDLALALDAAVGAGVQRITVVGGAGGRADHLLANWLLLAADDYAGCQVRSWSAAARTDVLRPGRTAELAGPVGALISLLPAHGPAREVRTSGLVFPLDGEDLPPGTSRGVSNRFAAPHATVTLAAGVLLAVRPLTHTELPS